MEMRNFYGRKITIIFYSNKRTYTELLSVRTKFFTKTILNGKQEHQKELQIRWGHSFSIHFYFCAKYLPFTPKYLPPEEKICPFYHSIHNVKLQRGFLWQCASFDSLPLTVLQKVQECRI